jgi:hypothetical protein
VGGQVLAPGGRLRRRGQTPARAGPCRETTEREIETLTETKTTLQAAVDTLRAAAAKV